MIISRTLGLATLALVSLAAAPAAHAGDTQITNFSKTNNIFTNLNQQFPNTGAGVPGSTTGVANASFLFNPATYTSLNAVAGANQTTNGTTFLISSDASGRDFSEIGGTPLTISTNLFGVTSVHTLTNSYFNAQETITFTGSGGASETFSGVQLHDFNARAVPSTIASLSMAAPRRIFLTRRPSRSMTWGRAERAALATVILPPMAWTSKPSC